MKVSRNFILQEFIDPEIYQLRGEKSIELIDYTIVMIAQKVRNYFDVPCIINNWHEGGGYKESGLRKFLTKTGASFSQHKFGRAIDIKIAGCESLKDYDRIRAEILKYKHEFTFVGVTAMELDTPTWLHLDCRYTGNQNEILEIPYKN